MRFRPTAATRRHAARPALRRPALADDERSCSVSQVSDEGGGIKREQVVAHTVAVLLLCFGVLQRSMRRHLSHFVACCTKPRGGRSGYPPHLTCSLRPRPTRDLASALLPRAQR